MFQVRYMIRSDLRSVVVIDADNFSRRWGSLEFDDKLSERNCIGQVLEHERYGVIGYTMYELHKRRLSILRLAINPKLHRCGFGRLLIEELVDKLTPQRRDSIWVEVPEADLSAQLFFRAMGFRWAQTLEADDGREVYLMKYLVRRPEDAAWVEQVFGVQA